MKKETLEEISKRIFPTHNGLSVIASNKIMLRRYAWIKGVKWGFKNKLEYDKHSYELVLKEKQETYTDSDMTNYALYILHNDVITPREWSEKFKK